MESQREAIRQILQQAPGSIRELAREAELTHAALIQVRDGKTTLTPESVRKVAGALRRWSATCAELADRLETAQPKPKGGGG